MSPQIRAEYPILVLCLVTAFPSSSNSLVGAFELRGIESGSPSASFRSPASSTRTGSRNETPSSSPVPDESKTAASRTVEYGTGPEGGSALAARRRLNARPLSQLSIEETL